MVAAAGVPCLSLIPPSSTIVRYPARVPTTAALSSRGGNRSTARLDEILGLVIVDYGIGQRSYLSTCYRNIPSTLLRTRDESGVYYDRSKSEFHLRDYVWYSFSSLFVYRCLEYVVVYIKKE